VVYCFRLNFNISKLVYWITVPCTALQIRNTDVHVLSEISNPMKAQEVVKRFSLLLIVILKISFETARTI